MLGLVAVRETPPRLLTFGIKPLGRRHLESVRVAAARSGKVGSMHCARAWGTGSILAAKKHLEAKGRDDGGFISLSPSLASSMAEFVFVFFVFVPGPEPAAYA